MCDLPASEWLVFFLPSLVCWKLTLHNIDLGYTTVDHCYQALPQHFIFRAGTGSFLYPQVNVRCVSLLSPCHVRMGGVH